MSRNAAILTEPVRSVLEETTLSLIAAARRLPPGRRGRPVTLSCVFRWITDGVKLPSGDVVRLEAVRLGGRWITSVEALERFAARQTPDMSSRPAPTPTPPPATRQRAAAKAGAKLERMGL